MGTTPDALVVELTPITESLGLTLHDVEITKALIRVTIHKDGGISLEQLAEANRAISEHLDANEPFEGRYKPSPSRGGPTKRTKTPKQTPSQKVTMP